MSLAGKTLFVTGASRGIGLAIALRAARDGANVAVAAKTVTPDPRLPGTIFTAAEDIEKAGGKALPLPCDIRDEQGVEKAVADTVAKFGGIDILVNNASAISLTGTLATPIKRYDLMHQINGRGTYLVSQKCIPHLVKAANPHVLNLSPPLDFDVKWFANHSAYTLAKFGMSVYAWAMAAEFKDKGIAFNCLWPRTGIATSAIQNIDVLAARLDKQKQVLLDTLATLPGALNVLTGERTQLVKLLQGLDKLGGAATHVIEATSDTLTSALRQLDPVLTSLTKAGQDLPNALELAATFPFPKNVRGAVKGDNTNADLILDLNLSDLLSNLTSPTSNATHSARTRELPTIPGAGGH